MSPRTTHQVRSRVSEESSRRDVGNPSLMAVEAKLKFSDRHHGMLATDSVHTGIQQWCNMILSQTIEYGPLAASTEECVHYEVECGG